LNSSSPASLVTKDEIAFLHHVRSFRSDPVSDEAAMFPGLFVVEAFVADQIISWQPACQMEEVPGHGAALPPLVRRSKMPIILLLLVFLHYPGAAAAEKPLHPARRRRTEK
jgi:hypothetical protein